jgi:hypothetical protein
MIFNVSGGGGAALNFRVVGGTTAPTNPAENCIWVNTNTAITSWIFSATEPSPAEAGMVWISIGVSSAIEFNALKKNAIQVYPISANQYIGGAWVSKTAKSYQGGAWVEWVKWLYNAGDECTALTGGFTSVSLLKYTSGSAMGIGSVTKNANNIYLSALEDYQASVASLEMVDVTAYSKISMVTSNATIRTAAQTGANKLMLLSARTSISTIIASASIKDGITELDISGITGKYYVAVALSNSSAYIDEIYLS